MGFAGTSFFGDIIWRVSCKRCDSSNPVVDQAISGGQSKEFPRFVPIWNDGNSPVALVVQEARSGFVLVADFMELVSESTGA